MNTPQILMIIMLLWEFFINLWEARLLMATGTLAFIGCIIGISARVLVVTYVLYYGGFWN